MCGIIGYTGTENSVPKILKGISVLEYRGYDSVGIAAQHGGRVDIVKCKGRVGALEERLREQPLTGSCCAIGHTRWATHGGPSDRNAHPHRVGAVTLVHNGIIENCGELRAKFIEAGVTFLSETDTEVAAALINEYYQASHDPAGAIRAAAEKMKGAFAFAILFDGHEGEIFVIRRGSPLILARGQDGFYLASDMTANLPFTREYCAMRENELACLAPDGAFLLHVDGSREEPVWQLTSMSPESAQKGGFAHFMHKEIHEQPEAVVKSVSPRVNADGLPDFSSDGIGTSFWQSVKQIQIVACGSAMHAGMIGLRLFEEIAKIPVSVHIASEYRYHPPIAPEGTLLVVISQSGETADTLAALRYAKAQGIPTLAIVNAVETTIAREADHRIYTYAGPEIAVATTKGYCTQVVVLWMIAAAIGRLNGQLSDDAARRITDHLLRDAPAAMQQMLAVESEYRNIVQKLVGHEHVFYIGRGRDYALAMEAALKLKEISYIHCEAYAAGELKHGTISLIEQGTPVIVISTERALFDKIESNIREVRSRGAHVAFLCRADLEFSPDIADEVIRLPVTSEEATFFSALIAMQEIAYETAKQLGRDIDHPRNLAKSVTVE